MKKVFLIILMLGALAIQAHKVRAADRYWVHQLTYQNFFTTAAELAQWQLIEDDGTGGFVLSGNGSAILQMDDAAGGYANRLFSKNGASARLLPFDVVNGRVELLVKSITGGNQRIFMQAQEFTGSGMYIGQVNILPARSATGFFSVNLSAITWDPATVQVRFIIGGENYSGQQGTVEFGYFSYSNTNANWSNPANWSAISGGAGGASVPGISDNAIFNGAGNSNGSCLLDVNASANSLQTTSGFSGNIDLQSFQMTLGSGGAMIAGGGITGASQNIQINGNVTISGGAFTNPSGNTYVTGDVTITGGVLNFGTGTLVFNGSSDQQFLASVIAPVNNIVVDKPSGVINFSSNILVSGTLTLTNGILNMNGNTIHLGTSTGNIGTLVTTNGRINGNLARWINTTGTGIVAFPLGNIATIGTLNLTVVSPPSGGGIVTASYTDATPAFTPANFPDGASTILQVSAAHWNVGVSGLSGGNYSLSVAGGNLGTISSLADLHLTLANGVIGTYLPATGTLIAPVLNRSGITSANLAQTFYASLTGIPLPVTWLSFTVSEQRKIFTWSWTLAMEDNVAWYEPQYSADGNHFISAGRITQQRSDHTYSFSTALSQIGTISFRVQEVDRDGQTSYSGIKALSSTNTAKFSFYPNPVKDELTLEWPYSDGNMIHTIITDSQGKLVLARTDPYASSITIDLSILPAGIFFIRCSDSRNRQSDTNLLEKGIH